MSNDYDFEFNENEILESWLNRPYGMFSTFGEWIGEKYLPIVKEAFLEGYRKGLNNRNILNWKEQTQK